MRPCWVANRPPGETRQDRIKQTASALVALYDRAEAQAEDVYDIAEVEGRRVVATLVNVVYLSNIHVGHDGDGDAPPPPPLPGAGGERRWQGVSLAALYQGMLGVANFGSKTNGNLEVALRSRAPFRAKHSFTPGDMRLQETAATSDFIGQRVLAATLSMMSTALGAGVHLSAVDRRRTNEVYTAYLPFRLDLDRVRAALPKVVRVPKKFVGLIIEPSNQQMKLLLFPKGIAICVGSQHYSDMQTAMRRYIAEFVAAAVRDDDDHRETDQDRDRRTKRKRTVTQAQFPGRWQQQ